MGALASATALSRRYNTLPQAVTQKPFTAYLPALWVAILKDCLDLVFLMIAIILGLFPVAFVLQFVFGIGLGALSATLLFLFTGSKVSPVKRFLSFLIPQSFDALIPGVSLLPLATISILLVYFFDRKEGLSEAVAENLSS